MISQSPSILYDQFLPKLSSDENVSILRAELGVNNQQQPHVTGKTALSSKNYKMDGSTVDWFFLFREALRKVNPKLLDYNVPPPTEQDQESKENDKNGDGWFGLFREALHDINPKLLDYRKAK
jgi:hypothetical protein